MGTLQLVPEYFLLDIIALGQVKNYNGVDCR